MAKKLGEMTPEEKAQAIKRAAEQFQRELRRNASAIGKILEEEKEEENG
jgi:hypothetical protein